MDVLKRELAGVVEYLQTLDPRKVTDDIDWKTTAKGGMIPTIVSSEEQIIGTVIGEIKRSAKIIIAVFDNEGMSQLLKDQIDIMLEKLKEIQDFYLNQTQVSITHRRISIPGKNSFSVVAASKEQIIRARAKMTEDIMIILPMVDVIKTYQLSTVRGGGEATPAMIKFEKRRKAGLTNENMHDDE